MLFKHFWGYIQVNVRIQSKLAFQMIVLSSSLNCFSTKSRSVFLVMMESGESQSGRRCTEM